MKKKIIVLLLVAVMLLSGCTKNESDAKKFKEDYESLNNKENSSGVKYRTVSIDSKNPIVITTAEEIVKKIENKETFYVYFGDEQCPWCRSVIEKALEAAKNNNIKTIYYVSIWEVDHNESLRDKYVLDENNELFEEVHGSDAYYKLLNSFDSLLTDYTLKTDKGKVVNVNEKRIFAPSFVYVKSGKAKKLTTGISSKQEKYDSKLTDEILKDEEKLFKEFFEN